jgi:hypothetical protein
MSEPRDADTGRFLPGNAGGPGRKRRVTELSYLRTLSRTCTIERWAKICERVTQLAEQGDIRAVTFLATWLLPRPDGETPLAKMAAAAALHVSLRELDVESVYRQISAARCTGDVVANLAAARDAGVKISGPSHMLKIALGVNGDGGEHASSRSE